MSQMLPFAPGWVWSCTMGAKEKPKLWAAMWYASADLSHFVTASLFKPGEKKVSGMSPRILNVCPEWFPEMASALGNVQSFRVSQHTKLQCRRSLMCIRRDPSPPPQPHSLEPVKTTLSWRDSCWSEYDRVFSVRAWQGGKEGRRDQDHSAGFLNLKRGFFFFFLKKLNKKDVEIIHFGIKTWS